MTKMPYRLSVLWIGISVIVISGLSYFLYFGRPKIYAQKKHDRKYFIDTLMQTSRQKNALATKYLAELLELCIDKPMSFYTFDVKEAKKKLLQSPLIDAAYVKKFSPSTVYVEYDVKKPLAILADYANVGIDQKGYLFPLSPFIASENLPYIYLGLPSFGEEQDSRKGGRWLSPMHDRHFDLAKSLLLSLLRHKDFSVKIIDVSKAYFPSYGKREIVVLIHSYLQWNQNSEKKTAIFPFYLRLSTQGYNKELGNFLVLHKKVMNDYQKQLQFVTLPAQASFTPKVVDLRLSKVAYISEE